MKAQQGGTSPCTSNQFGYQTLMKRLATVLSASVDPSDRKRFRLLMIGVAGDAAYACEDVLIRAMLEKGFQFEEVGVIDPEDPMFHSRPGRVAEVSLNISKLLSAKQPQTQRRPTLVSQYVMTLGEDFMVKSGRARQGQARFDMCVYSSGGRQALVSVRGPNRAANLGLVIHACDANGQDQSEAYLYLPYAVDQRYRGEEVQCAWDWPVLLMHATGDERLSERIYLAEEIQDGSFGAASVFGVSAKRAKVPALPCEYHNAFYASRRPLMQSRHLQVQSQRSRRLGAEHDALAFSVSTASRAATSRMSQMSLRGGSATNSSSRSSSVKTPASHVFPDLDTNVVNDILSRLNSSSVAKPLASKKTRADSKASLAANRVITGLQSRRLKEFDVMAVEYTNSGGAPVLAVMVSGLLYVCLNGETPTIASSTLLSGSLTIETPFVPISLPGTGRISVRKVNTVRLPTSFEMDQTMLIMENYCSKKYPEFDEEGDPVCYTNIINNWQVVRPLFLKSSPTYRLIARRMSILQHPDRASMRRPVSVSVSKGARSQSRA